MNRTIPILLAACLAVVGCERPTRVRPNAPRPRVVTHAPSLTQIVFDLGLGDHVVGVTKFCILPDGEVRISVGNGNQVNTEMLLSVEPDVVMIQQAPGPFDALLSVAPETRVEHFVIDTLGDIPPAIERVARLIGDEQLGRRKRKEFEDLMADLRRRAEGRKRPRVLFVAGHDDLSTHGQGTFIGDMIELVGGTNAAAESYAGWVRLSTERVLALEPDVLICEVAPKHAQAARARWAKFTSLPAVYNGRVHVVTDRRWTIPSTRTAGFLKELAEMIHPSAGGGRGE